MLITLMMLPAAIALALKLYMLSYKSSRDWAGNRWLTLVSVLAALNFSELLIYSSGYSGYVFSDYLLRSYYVACIICLVYGYVYVAVDIKSVLQKSVFVCLTVIAVVQIAAFLFSGHMIDGYYMNGTFVVAVKQQGFIAFQVFAIAAVALILSTMIYNYRKAADAAEKLAHAYTLFALTPLGLAILVVIVLMLLGMPGNGSMIIPVATTVFLLITAKGKSLDSVHKDPRAINPLSAEARVSKKLSWAQIQLMIGNMGLKETVDTLEASLIDYKLDQNNGNISKTARDLGISRSTLNSKLRKPAK